MTRVKAWLIGLLIAAIVIVGTGVWVYILKARISGLRDNVSVLQRDLQVAKDELSAARRIGARLDGILTAQSASVDGLKKSVADLNQRIGNLKPSDGRNDDERKAIECLDLAVPVGRVYEHTGSESPRM